MRDISFFKKIYIAVQPVDFRKQAHGLAITIDQSLDLDSLTEKSLFVFTNKRKNAVKILYWDLTGYALWWKTLEKDKFKWPKPHSSGTIELTAKELKWLLEGIDLSKLEKHEKLILK